MSFCCFKCGEPSGTLLVHHECRKFLLPSEHRRLTILWHHCVIDTAYDAARDEYQCHHCRRWFPRNMVIGDHFPVTKGADENVRFDVSKGVCSCSGCNSGATNHRHESIRKLNRKRLCTRCGFLLAARDGLCYRCIEQP